MTENVKISSGMLLMVAAVIIGVVAVFVLSNTHTAIASASSSDSQPSGVQQISILMHPLGYEPDIITLKKGVPVKLTLKADNNAGCTRSIVFPEFGITKLVPRGDTATVEFTPTRSGTFPFMCSMNMARGTVIVE